VSFLGALPPAITAAVLVLLRMAATTANGALTTTLKIRRLRARPARPARLDA
jgi:hypothetical protein